MDPIGNLYGATFVGGGPFTTGCGTGGNGVVYKLDPSGKQTVLHKFKGGTDGCNPAAGVVRDSAGNLYGTTWYGGAYGAGTVFEIDSSGNETVLYSFTPAPRCCAPPGTFTRVSGVVLDAAGNLYGTTLAAGASGGGIVFEFDTSGSFKVLHNFDTSKGGYKPSGSLTLDSAGNPYGTTYHGGPFGAFGWGTVIDCMRAGRKPCCTALPAVRMGAPPTVAWTLPVICSEPPIRAVPTGRAQYLKSLPRVPSRSCITSTVATAEAPLWPA